MTSVLAEEGETCPVELGGPRARYLPIAEHGLIGDLHGDLGLAQSA